MKSNFNVKQIFSLFFFFFLSVSTVFADATTQPLLQQGDLKYLGSFNLDIRF